MAIFQVNLGANLSCPEKWPLRRCLCVLYVCSLIYFYSHKGTFLTAIFQVNLG